MSKTVPDIYIKDYTYVLPESQIALQPMDDRSASKMLVYKAGIINDYTFKAFPDILPEHSLIVLNETKVINARLHFKKATGAHIEIFCLQPDPQYKDITNALLQKGKVYWQCIIGGKKKWKDPNERIFLSISESITLTARVHEENKDQNTILFEWNDAEMSFAEVLAKVGEVPLPPYIKRAIETSDADKYQTVFAKNDGSVAAPTASLHLTTSLLEQLSDTSQQIEKINLHVGAGTFMPVKSDAVNEHTMHEEWIEVKKSFIENWIEYLHKPTVTNTVAVGTTACRTLESLYWIGVKLIDKIEIDWNGTALKQWESYSLTQDYSLEDSLKAILQFLNTHQLDILQTKTQLLILPGYTFKSIDILVTNFHQPESTLLLLVAAFTKNHYKKIYQHALENNYRFLSYGDGSVLFKH